jgi:GT2 family glycosyltransferase
MNYKVVLGIVSYERHEYLEKCLDTLKRSNLIQNIDKLSIVIIDDHSKDKRVHALIDSYLIERVEIKKVKLKINRGHPNSVVKILLKLFKSNYTNYDFWGVIDNDVIFKENWLFNLLQLYEESQQMNLKIKMMTGFNATGHCKDGGGAELTHIYETKAGKFGTKQFVGGAQLLMRPSILKEFGWWDTNKRKGGWDRQWSRISDELGYSILVSIPSTVQHIGAIGIHSKRDLLDIARDFN